MNNLDIIKGILTSRKIKLSVAESCTGGLISSLLTDVDGASNFIEINFVTYSNYAKERFLNVPKSVIDEFGVVSSEVASKMAEGLLKYAGISIATTGYAGNLPSGDENNPKGTVYYAFCYKDKLKVQKYNSNKVNRTDIKFDMAHHIINDFRLFLKELFDD